MMDGVGSRALSSREKLESREDGPVAAGPAPARAAAEPDWSSLPSEWHAPLALPTPARRAAPPPAPKDSTPALPSLPAAPDALHGTKLAWLAENLPRTERSPVGHVVTAGDYRLHPQMQKVAGGGEAVAYWTAHNVLTKRTEFVVGPDSLESFTRNTHIYVDAAARSASQGVPTHLYEVESQRVVESLMNEGLGAGLRHLGQAWGAAFHDPHWWTKTAGDLILGAGPALAARGGGEVALATEATPLIDEATRLAAARAAKGVLSAACAAEPEITTTVSAAAKANGGTMVGLEARLKTEASLSRKIASDAESVAKVDTAAAGVKDAVRYTASYDATHYGEGFRSVVKQLESQGYEVRTLKNTWASDGYRGVNVSLRAPSGQAFELQFHTPESFAAKTEGHLLYEEWRAPGTSAERRAVLTAEMRERFRMVPIPPGAIDFRLLETLAQRGIGFILPALTRKETP